MADIAPPAPEETETAADVGALYLARVYAQALLGAAESEGVLETIIDELEAFVAQIVVPNPALGEFLRSGIVSRENKQLVLQKALQERVSPLLLRFLLVLNRHQRLGVLAAAAAACREIDNRRRNRIPVQLTSAVPLSEDLAEEIRSRLASALAMEPIVRARIDPAVIGGLVVRVGDSVYDGSLATQLERLREQILQRSVHEIQSGRNRFSDSTGD